MQRYGLSIMLQELALYFFLKKYHFLYFTCLFANRAWHNIRYHLLFLWREPFPFILGKGTRHKWLFTNVVVPLRYFLCYKRREVFELRMNDTCYILFFFPVQLKL